MNKTAQRKKAMAYQRIRNLTVGMHVETWEKWKAGVDAEGKQIFDCVCRDRWGNDLSRDVFRVASRINRRWLVMLRVHLRTDDGQTYFDDIEMEAPSMKLDDFTDIYKEQRGTALEKINPKHFIDIGWRAEALD